MAQSDIHYTRATTSSGTNGEWDDGRRGMTMIQRMLETPKFHYDISFDLKAIQSALKSASFLQDSGYRSIIGQLEESATGSGGEWGASASSSNAPPPACKLYGTGWMVADNLSGDGDDADLQLAGSDGRATNDDMNWGEQLSIQPPPSICNSQPAIGGNQT